MTRADSRCSQEHCLTCSDSAVAVTVKQLLPHGLAVVDTGRGEEEISVALVAVRVGDTVLVHANEALAVLPAAAQDEAGLADD
jgi:hydrogenase maturation factor